MGDNNEHVFEGNFFILHLVCLVQITLMWSDFSTGIYGDSKSRLTEVGLLQLKGYAPIAVAPAPPVIPALPVNPPPPRSVQHTGLSVCQETTK